MIIEQTAKTLQACQCVDVKMGKLCVQTGPSMTLVAVSYKQDMYT